MTYYNTTQQQGLNLVRSWMKTAKQDDLILLVFARNKKSILTPFEVLNILNEDFDRIFPITSVRRSINTLTEINALEKTPIKRKGYYGRANYCWKYKD
jgi:hypothetical protein|tara:strand:+ start:318 stop:611 length:294 start_codon:yes stop_codon:yes gene_type:complete